MTNDKLYTSLSANTIMAKLTNQFQRTRLITSSPDKHYPPDSEDDLRSGCRNVSHQQQFFSELHPHPDDDTIRTNETMLRTSMFSARAQSSIMLKTCLAQTLELHEAYREKIKAPTRSLRQYSEESIGYLDLIRPRKFRTNDRFLTFQTELQLLVSNGYMKVAPFAR